jgi:hypothetical protein
MNRCVLALSVPFVALSLPAAALASTSAVVLTASPAHHVQVIDAAGTVHAYTAKGAPKLTLGTPIRYRQAHGKLTDVTVRAHKAKSVSFHAKVITRTAKRLTVRLGDAHAYVLTAKQLKDTNVDVQHGKQTTASTLSKLTAGETMRITEPTTGGGTVTILATAPTKTSNNPPRSTPPPGTPPGVPAAGELDGTLTTQTDTTFTVTDSAGDAVTFFMDAEDLSDQGLQWCDEVDVTYHSDARTLEADNVDDNGASAAGACAALGVTETTFGTITGINNVAETMTLNPGSGQAAVKVNLSDDPTISDGFSVGDGVTVDYALDQDQTEHAQDIEYLDYTANGGVVTAVTDTSVTVSGTTYAADSAFTSLVTVGDQVDLTYNVIAGTPTVEDDSSVDNGSQ